MMLNMVCAAMCYGQGRDGLVITQTVDAVELSGMDGDVLQASSNMTTWSDLGGFSGTYTNGADAETEYFRLRPPNYTFFNYEDYPEIMLMDHDKNLVHTWTNDFAPAASVYMFPDGSIMSATRAGHTRLEKRDWESNLLWSYDNLSRTNRQHHDIEPLPNGNVLIIAREPLPAADVIASGRDPDRIVKATQFMSETIVEIMPTGTDGGKVVWRWDVMDHIIQDFDETKPNFGVISEHPELVNINYATERGIDWLHANAVTYNAELDQIMISMRGFNEIWIIDHSTTIAEAASHSGGARGRGGDLLYRWGNPQAYNLGTEKDQVLGGQHDPSWIPAGYPGEGHILMFNNGTHRLYSSVDEIIPPLQEDGSYFREPGKAYGPTNLTWTYQASVPTNFYSFNFSGTQRLPDGNTLISDGHGGRIFEVTPDGTTVWSHDLPDGKEIFWARRVYFELPE